MEYIISFINTNYAVKAEQCLLARGMNVGVLPVPSQIRAGCGICLRLGADEIENATTALAECGIIEIGLYSREKSESGYVYTEITDRGE